MSESRPPPPSSSQLPPPPPSGFAQHTDCRPVVPNHVPRTSRVRPLVYAVGVSAIVGAGALIGAYLKTGQQREAAIKTRQALLQPQPQPPTTDPRAQDSPATVPLAPAPSEAAHAKTMETLQTKRAHLFAQKTGLETKLRTFREEQARKVQEERLKKELGLKE